jgi:ribosomal protein S18 acetylase RimI-like enzyme
MTNFERMIALAAEVFNTKADGNQLDVDQDVLARLAEIHPASVGEYDDGNGPVAWVILIPTTTALMNSFLRKEISEKQLYEQTPIGEKYETIYLCSAMVLPEFRRKGIAKKLAMDAIAEIRKDHDIKTLFTWPFTPEGKLTAEDLAKSTALDLTISDW